MSLLKGRRGSRPLPPAPAEYQLHVSDEARQAALYHDSCELAKWLESARLSEYDREESRRLVDNVARGDMTLEEAMELLRERSDLANVEWRKNFRKSSAGCMLDISAQEFTEIETMGDWATDSFDWDGTDVGLVGTGETAFDWLQKKGYISLGYSYEELDPQQQSSLDALRRKLADDGSSNGPNMSAEHELAEVLRLLPWPVPGRSDSLRSNGYSARKEQNMNMKNMEGNGYAVLKPSALSARPDEAPAVTAEELAGVTRRLGRVWLEGTNAMAANELIDKEISQLLLTSRARLQAEVVSLRRENEALRLGRDPSSVTKALMAEKELTAMMQKLLDQRDARMRHLLHDLAKQNDALSVLRSKVKLHKRFNKGEAPPSRQASLRPPGPARSRISSVRSTASNGSRQSDRADFGPQMQVRLDSIRRRMGARVEEASSLGILQPTESRSSSRLDMTSM